MAPARENYVELDLGRLGAGALRNTLAQLQADAERRVLFLTAVELVFDQPESRALPASEVEAAIRDLYRMPMPVVVAVGGDLAGAALSLALAGDIVVAGEHASFMATLPKPTRIGLDAPGATYLLPHRVGIARATGMLLLGDKLTAPEAQNKGLIWKCVPPDRLMDEGRGIARYLAAQPPEQLGAIKRALRASAANALEEQLELEAALLDMAPSRAFQLAADQATRNNNQRS